MSGSLSRVTSFKRRILGVALLTGAMLGSPAPAETVAIAAEIAQIDCITPDGKVNTISRSDHIESKSAASWIDETTISCLLRQGETTFVIELPKNASRDRLTFINENGGACGELKIAVADAHLGADSPKWKEVDGIIPFAHKRLFNLSLLGIETKFVRLSFHVEGADGAERNVAHLQNVFQTSALAEAISSHFVMSAHAQRTPVGASFGSLSVAPLTTSPNK
jgi:hypothetical protein